MKNKFYISDTHFGHTNSWEKFKLADGSPLRPFSSTEEMDEHMITKWNSVVGEYDIVYHLGDVCIGKKHLDKISRLNGKKKLIMGNHDIFKAQSYFDAGFYDVASYRVFVDEFVCSHIPLHPDCISERFIANVHGHTHANSIMRETLKIDEIELRNHPDVSPYRTVIEKDPRYFAVCVEQINYTPIAHEDLKLAIKKRQKEANYNPPEKGWGNGSGPG